MIAVMTEVGKHFWRAVVVLGQRLTRFHVVKYFFEESSRSISTSSYMFLCTYITVLYIAILSSGYTLVIVVVVATVTLSAVVGEVLTFAIIGTGVILVAVTIVGAAIVGHRTALIEPLTLDRVETGHDLASIAKHLLGVLGEFGELIIGDFNNIIHSRNVLSF